MRAQVPAQGAQVGAGARPLARASGAQVARKSPLGKERAQVTFVPRKCARKWRASPLRGSTFLTRVYKGTPAPSYHGGHWNCRTGNVPRGLIKD